MDTNTFVFVSIGTPNPLFRLLSLFLLVEVVGILIRRQRITKRRQHQNPDLPNTDISPPTTGAKPALIGTYQSLHPLDLLPLEKRPLFILREDTPFPQYFHLTRREASSPRAKEDLFRLIWRLSRAQRKALVRRARYDYRHARGYLHRSVLRAARKDLEKQDARYYSEIADIQKEMAALHEKEQYALARTLEYSIVWRRFGEVPGIGPALKQRILSELRPKRLADLRRASIVHGVGQGRQKQIEKWIQQYQAKMPKMLNSPFPGRVEVEQQFANQLDQLETRLQILRYHRDRANQIRQRIDQELSWLEEVREKDFVANILDAESADKDVEEFLKGLFQEWEPVPDWFKQIVEGRKLEERKPSSNRQFFRRVKTKPLPLAYELDVTDSGQHVLKTMKRGDNLPTPMRNLRALTKYGYIEATDDGRTLYVVGTDDRAILRAVQSLDPYLSPDGFVFDVTPPVLRFLRQRATIHETEASKEITVSSTPPKLVLKVDYNPCSGLILQTGYSIDGVDEIVPAGKVISLDDNHIRIGKHIVPVPSGFDSRTQDFFQCHERRISPAQIPEFFARDLILLKKDFRIVLTESASRIRILDEPWQPVVKVRKTKNGWLDFEINYRVGSEEWKHSSVPDGEPHSEYYQLDQYTWLRRKQQLIKRIEKQLRLLEPTVLPEGYRIPISRFASLQDFIDEIGGLPELNQEYRKFLDQLVGFCADENFHLDEEIETDLRLNGITLRPYQRAGIHWLYWLHSFHLHGLLADDMGLGKTIQSICALRQAYTDLHIAQHSLVIAPQSVLIHWKREIERVYPTAMVVVYHGASRYRYQHLFTNVTPVIFITTYATAANDIEFLQSVPFYFLILDEATRIKNPTVKRTKAIKTLNAAHRIALSGTPVENRPRELWSVFDFLMRGHLGKYGTFQRIFESAILAGDFDTSERLGKRIRPFLLRRRKDEVAKDLPSKIEMDEWCKLTLEQRKLYGELQNRTSAIREALVRGESVNYTGSILPVITKLKQICDHPAIVIGDRDRLFGRSEKFDRIVEKIRSIQESGEQVVIFSHFLGMLDLLGRAMDMEKLPFIRIDGSTHQRQVLIDRFNNGEAKVALCSLMAAGYGISLTTANHVLHADRWWNPAVEDQATDRVHRIGQERTVYVYRILVQGTLEEKIDRLLAKKRKMSARIINAATAGEMQWSREELLEILQPLEE